MRTTIYEYFNRRIGRKTYSDVFALSDDIANCTELEVELPDDIEWYRNQANDLCARIDGLDYRLSEIVRESKGKLIIYYENFSGKHWCKIQVYNRVERDNVPMLR